MSSWSQRRKLIYSSSIIIFLILIIGLPVFFYLYKAPTCSDGLRNGDEKGVDCGGSCQRLCQDSFMTPQVSWTRMENVAPELYNVATYIVNPNTKAVAVSVPYRVVVYDNKGLEITEFIGKVTLPPHRNTLAFNGAVSMGKRIPAKASFEFTQPPLWQTASDPLSGITIGDKSYSEDASGTSLTVKINNTTPDNINNIDIYSVLYDKDSNAIGFSKTLIDNVPAYGSSVAPFTWPTSFGGKVISIEVLPVAN